MQNLTVTLTTTIPFEIHGAFHISNSLQFYYVLTLSGQVECTGCKDSVLPIRVSNYYETLLPYF